MANRKQSRRKRKSRNSVDPALFSKLSPQQIAVIAGLLVNALTVDSVLIDKNKRLQIVLGGTLRRKTRLDRLLQEIGGMNVADVIDSILNSGGGGGID